MMHRAVFQANHGLVEQGEPAALNDRGEVALVLVGLLQNAGQAAGEVCRLPARRGEAGQDDPQGLD